MKKLNAWAEAHRNFVVNFLVTLVVSQMITSGLVSGYSYMTGDGRWAVAGWLFTAGYLYMAYSFVRAREELKREGKW